ncbi:hypothetical protein Smp_145750 [Schistosoma mansoni]|uniref:hypothetical protein n=1 Tax=Schistosoma mansoni TaxID=6183 RepID=UPI00019B3661|nr:hypothetical protein Smp_145750 [Schistosoma mansoni]|eukprot:XP_018647385.1 hypothetical protein Smp_145750 [Schistosoma mansoni]
MRTPNLRQIHSNGTDANNNQRTVVQSFSLRNRAVYPIGLVSKFLVANSLSVLSLIPLILPDIVKNFFA